MAPACPSPFLQPCLQTHSFPPPLQHLPSYDLNQSGPGGGVPIPCAAKPSHDSPPRVTQLPYLPKGHQRALQLCPVPKDRTCKFLDLVTSFLCQF